jgi:hypothetical protein
MTMPGSRPPDYATKDDLAALRGEFVALRGEFAELRAEFAELRAEFRLLRETIRADVSEQISALKSTMITTTIASLVAMTAIFGALVTVLKLFG